MSDALKDALRAVDGTQASIQGAAGRMMAMYNRGAPTAVTLWKDAVHQARQKQKSDMALNLLYVANEVLQTSKRNRGDAFLEAFAADLGPSLQAVCQIQDNMGTDDQGRRKLTEKVRRVVKIWGDRRVFSVRFVTQLLQGLEPYRHTAAPNTKSSSTSPSPASLATEATKEAANDNEGEEEDDIMKLLDQDDGQQGEESSHNDEDDIFAGTGESKLQIDLDLDRMANSASGNNSSKPKRRRSSMGSTGSASSHKKARRKRTVLSIPHLVDTLQRLQRLQQDASEAQRQLEKIDDSLKDAPDEATLESLVGTELQTTYQQTNNQLRSMADARASLYRNAVATHATETELEQQYLPWLEAALPHDDEDIKFCDTLEAQLTEFLPLHAQLVQARAALREQQAQQRAAQAEAERKRREQEETERFRQAALARKTAGDGKNMVWNPATREYEERNTDESWREH